MATIDDAILEVVRGVGTPEDKVKIIKELTAAAPTDRWTIRYVIWGLLAIVIIVGIGGVTVYGITQKVIPDGIIALGTTALGALAAYLVPPSHTAPTTMPAETASAATATPTTAITATTPAIPAHTATTTPAPPTMLALQRM